jgi:hypothetical protein
MRAREYIRHVYEDLMTGRHKEREYPRGAFLEAAVQVVRELESPLKEETLVRLAVLEIESERETVSQVKNAM